MKTALEGLGIWVWELPRCEGGDVAKIAARARRSGVRWVAFKAGGPSGANGQWRSELASALREAGVEACPWWYCVPKALDDQLRMVASFAAAGARQILMDAEVEWDSPDRRPLAAAFARDLRAALPDTWLADAPWARPYAHRAPFPYAEFGAAVDARMPQFYWRLAAPEPAQHFFATADLEWQQRDPGAVLCPALSPVDYRGTSHAPIEETSAALDRYQMRTAYSLWSWQHLSPDEWGLLERRAAAAEVPVDVTDGGLDRPAYLRPSGPPAEG